MNLHQKNNIEAKPFVDDLMNLESFAENLLKHAITESAVNAGSAVISLNAEFGMGKSYFLKMFEKFLNEKETNCLSINSWENDFYNEPLIVLLCEFNIFLEGKNDNLATNLKEVIGEAIEVAGNVIFGISNQIVKNTTGFDPRKTLEDAKPKNSKSSSIFNDYNNKKSTLKNLKNALEKYTEKLQKPLIILIDELDRTRPSYAVEFLETLKHFFDVKNIVFILAVNKKQLEASVQCLYGDINFDEYYRKFASQNIELPYFEERIENYISKKIIEIFGIAELDIDISSDENIKGKELVYLLLKVPNPDRIIKMTKYFIKNLKLSPRDVNELIRLMANIKINQKELYNYNIFDPMALTIFLIVNLHDSKIGKKIAEGTFGYNEFCQFFEENNFDEPEDYKHNIYISLSMTPIAILSYITANSEENFNQNIDKFINGRPIKHPEDDVYCKYKKTMFEYYIQLKNRSPEGQSAIQYIAKKILNIGAL